MHLPLPRTPFHPDPLPRTCQVVAKSCKMVPVMLMGYLVSRKRYTALEYCMAVAITSGAAIFKLNEEADPEQDDRTSTQLIGIVLIVCYMGATPTLTPTPSLTLTLTLTPTLTPTLSHP